MQLSIAIWLIMLEPSVLNVTQSRCCFQNHSSLKTQTIPRIVINNCDRKTTLWHKTTKWKSVYRPKIRHAACVLSKLQAHQKRVLNGVRPVYDKGIQRPWRSFQKRHPIYFISSNFKSHRPLIYSVCLKSDDTT